MKNTCVQESEQNYELQYTSNKKIWVNWEMFVTFYYILSGLDSFKIGIYILMTLIRNL